MAKNSDENSFSQFEMRAMDTVVNAMYRQLKTIDDPAAIEKQVKKLKSVEEEAEALGKLKKRQRREYKEVEGKIANQLATLDKMVNLDADMDIARALEIIRELENAVRREKSARLARELEAERSEVTAEVTEQETETPQLRRR